MRSREALDFLDLKIPKVKKGMTAAQVRKVYADWKAEALPAAVKAAKRKHHPDMNPDDPDAAHRFKMIPEAEALVEKLRFRIPEDKVTCCRICDATRSPEDAAFCVSCGIRYKCVPVPEACPCCEGERHKNAKFCHSCGYSYQPTDHLIERCRAAGITEKRLKKLREDGTLARWRKVSASHPSLAKAIADEAKMSDYMRTLLGNM
tara:strand:- start:36 stop:650 length:615 start_codon:yes stop_codon:yes gene_type:complete